tara:strand:- start:66 stop:1115 length:1050 start_codon:yes stop_codon:yes gene_type:complete
MFKILNPAEDTVTTQITVTNGFFDGGVGIKAGSNYTTSSLSSAQKNYYYNIQYNSKDHFSCTYGHIAGSGSSEQSTNIEGTTQAVYKQFYNLTEISSEKLRDETGWIMNNITQSDAYIIAAERLQMKDRLNPGTWTITLSGSTTMASGSSLSLTDDSKTTDPLSPGSPFGEVYSIVQGSAGSVTTAASTTTYGLFYPDAGLFVLSGTQMSASLPGSGSNTHTQMAGGSRILGNGLAPDTRVNSAADNAWKITRALQLGSVTLRSEEKQYIYDYFCRAKANEYNYSNNITFWSGSTYEIRHSDMVTNPQTYISEVGLYDNQYNLVAIGRLSSPINKNFSSEAIVKVRLTY